METVIEILKLVGFLLIGAGIAFTVLIVWLHIHSQK